MKVLFVATLVASLALAALHMRLLECLPLLWVRICIPLALLHVLGDPRVLAMRGLQHLGF